MSCMPTQMPRNGRPLLAHRLVQRLDHAGHRIEAVAAIGEGADARQHHAVGAAHRVGIAGDHDRLVEPALARGALERLGGRVQIAGAVIDDRDASSRRSRLREQAEHALAAAAGAAPVTSAKAPACRVDWQPAAAVAAATPRRPTQRLEEAALGARPDRRRHHQADGRSSRGAKRPAAQRCRPRSPTRRAIRNADRHASRRRTRRPRAERRPARCRDQHDSSSSTSHSRCQQHPQRTEQERPEIEAVAHEDEAIGGLASRSSAAAVRARYRCHIDSADAAVHAYRRLP